MTIHTAIIAIVIGIGLGIGGGEVAKWVGRMSSLAENCTVLPQATETTRGDFGRTP